MSQWPDASIALVTSDGMNGGAVRACHGLAFPPAPVVAVADVLRWRGEERSPLARVIE